MKRLFSVVMSIVFVICTLLTGLFSFTAVAATNGVTGDCTWSLDGTVLTIKGNGEMGHYFYSTPAPWGTEITKVIIQEGVTGIGNNSFFDCTSLVDITIPSSVKVIGENAFYNCSSLTEIAIPDILLQIKGGAFVKTGYYNNIDNWESDVLYIGKHLIYANYLISGTCNVKQGTLDIADYAFLGCSSITELVIPDTVNYIGVSAFSHCSSLKEVKLPSDITAINDDTFNACASMLSVTMPTKMKTIGDSAFRDCRSLVKVVFPEATTTIQDFAFYGCSSITNVTFGKNIEKIGRSAFYGCDELKDVYYGGSWVSSRNIFIDSSLGSSCLTIATWHYADTEDVLVYSYNNSDLTATVQFCALFAENVTIPKTVEKDGKVYTITGIVSRAFYQCKSLKKVVIGADIKSVGESAFASCDALLDVYYDGTADDRQTISVQKGNDLFNNATWHYSGISVKPKEHTYGDWVTTKEPTCESKGEMTRSCLNCDYKETKEVAALGHKFSKPEVIKQPSCTDNGVESGVCIRCGKETTNSIAPTGHKFEEFTVTVEPTCITDGKKESTCIVCGAKSEQIIAASGHSYNEGVVTKEATEHEVGIKVKTCDICGEVEHVEIPKLTTSSDAEALSEPTEEIQHGDDFKYNTTMIWTIVVIVVCGIVGGVTLTIVLLKKKKK